jgi:hypothetical protein
VVGRRPAEHGAEYSLFGHISLPPNLEYGGARWEVDFRSPPVTASSRKRQVPILLMHELFRNRLYSSAD